MKAKVFLEKWNNFKRKKIKLKKLKKNSIKKFMVLVDSELG